MIEYKCTVSNELLGWGVWLKRMAPWGLRHLFVYRDENGYLLVFKGKRMYTKTDCKNLDELKKFLEIE